MTGNATMKKPRESMPADGRAWGAMGAVTLLLAAATGLVLWLQRDTLTMADCGAAASPGVNWQGCRLLALSAEHADLRGVAFAEGSAPGARLRGADLAAADLRSVDLRGADLRDARLGGANLAGADLRDADLRDAQLLDADLSAADLRGARLDGADLRYARLGEAVWIDGEPCAAHATSQCLQQAQAAVAALPSAGKRVEPTADAANADSGIGNSTL